MKTQNFADSNGLDTIDYTYWHLNVNKRAFQELFGVRAWIVCNVKAPTVATAVTTLQWFPVDTRVWAQTAVKQSKQD